MGTCLDGPVVIQLDGAISTVGSLVSAALSVSSSVSGSEGWQAERMIIAILSGRLLQ